MNAHVVIRGFDRLIRSVWQRFGMTLLFVTHDIDESKAKQFGATAVA